MGELVSDHYFFVTKRGEVAHSPKRPGVGNHLDNWLGDESNGVEPENLYIETTSAVSDDKNTNNSNEVIVYDVASMTPEEFQAHLDRVISK